MPKIYGMLSYQTEGRKPMFFARFHPETVRLSCSSCLSR